LQSTGTRPGAENAGMRGTRLVGSGGVSLTRVVAFPVLLAAIGVAGFVLLAAGGAVLDAASGYLAFGAASLWPVIGPHLVVASLIAVLGSLAGGRVSRRTGRVALVLSGAASVASVLIVGAILVAIVRGGGTANPIAALVTSDMDAATPDATEEYRTDAGESYPALVYRPMATGSPAPVLLYIHGGGWFLGRAGANAADHRWFADRGWLVVSVDYPLASATSATWQRAPDALGCALTWVADNAARLGGDPSRIVVAGDSAGGHLAVNLAHGAAAGLAPSACAASVPVPAAVIPSYPVVDPQDAFDHGLALPGVDPRQFVPWFIGGQPGDHPDRMRAIASATYLSRAAPPTLLIEPDHDGLIPTAGVLRWAARAREAGVDITVVHIPFANHGFDQQRAGSLGNQGRRSIVEAWLRQRALGPGRPAR
jgi:acetyl esterase/lipase